MISWSMNYVIRTEDCDRENGSASYLHERGLSENYGRNSYKKKKIAIVDDKEAFCTIVSLALTKMSYDASLVFHDGSEIVDAVLSGTVRPDLILMDYRMQTTNGIAAATTIKSQKPEIVIVIFSADHSIGRLALSAGFSFLPKPFSMEELFQIVHDSLVLPKTNKRIILHRFAFP